jgi:hypothetical protein
MRAFGGDPVAWASQLARTKRRVVIWTLVHLAFVAGGIALVYKRGMEAGAFPLVYIGVVMPCLYLGAMHELLKSLGKEKSAEGRSAGDVGPAPEE